MYDLPTSTGRYATPSRTRTTARAAYSQSDPGGSTRMDHDRFASFLNRFADLDPRMDHRQQLHGSSSNSGNSLTLTQSALHAATKTCNNNNNNNNALNSLLQKHGSPKYRKTKRHSHDSRYSTTRSDIGFAPTTTTTTSTNHNNERSTHRIHTPVMSNVLTASEAPQPLLSTATTKQRSSSTSSRSGSRSGSTSRRGGGGGKSPTVPHEPQRHQSRRRPSNNNNNSGDGQRQNTTHHHHPIVTSPVPLDHPTNSPVTVDLDFEQLSQRRQQQRVQQPQPAKPLDPPPNAAHTNNHDDDDDSQKQHRMEAVFGGNGINNKSDPFAQDPFGTIAVPEANEHMPDGRPVTDNKRASRRTRELEQFVISQQQQQQDDDLFRLDDDRVLQHATTTSSSNQQQQQSMDDLFRLDDRVLPPAISSSNQQQQQQSRDDPFFANDDPFFTPNLEAFAQLERKRQERRNRHRETDYNDSCIVQVNQRAAIETTCPAQVKKLRRKLWTDDEKHLLVTIPPSMNDDHVEDELNTSALKRQEEKDQLPFHSRYYQAAQQSMLEESPESGNSGRNNNNKRQNESVLKFWDSSRTDPMDAFHHHQQQQDDEYHDENYEQQPPPPAPDTTTTMPEEQQTLRSVKTNENRSVKTRSTSTTTAHTSEATADLHSMIKRIGEMNRDDPQAALEQIDALLNLQTAQGAEKHSSQEETPQEKEDHPRMVSPVAEDDDEDSFSDETTVSSITNPTYQELQERKVKRSTSGNPRPSVLQRYANNHRNNPSPVESVRKRTKERKTVTPPTSVKVSKCAESYGREVAEPEGSHPSEAPQDRGASLIPKETENKKESLVEKLKAAEMDLNQGTNSLMAASSIDDRTTRTRWDELSNGIVPIRAHGNLDESMDTTKELGSILTPQDNASRKSHPWDSAMPVRMGRIDTRDTSMESAIGVEAQFTPRYALKKKVKEPSGMSPIRQLRKERLSRRINSIKEEEPTPAFPEFSREVIDDDGQAPPEFSPTQEVAKEVSADFDTAWVNLPSTSYFGTPKRQARKEDAFAAEQVDVEVQYLPLSSADRRDLQTFSPKSDKQVREQSALEKRVSGGVDRVGSWDGASRSSSKKSRGLRGFLKRRNKKGGGSSLYTTGKMSQSNANKRRSGRSRSPSRNRSHSLEDIRNPNIARKFSRVLKVYEENR